MSLNDKLLTEYQMREWPGSKILTDAQLVEALKKDRAYLSDTKGQPIDWYKHIAGYRRHYPNAVAYTVVDSVHRCYGLRYGFEGHEYISF